MCEKVIAVAFDDGKPFSIVTVSGKRGFSFYDVDYCKRDKTLYYHLSGFGSAPYGIEIEGCGEYWLADGYRLGRYTKRQKRPRLETLDAKWQCWPFEWGIKSDTVYCKICKDRLPTSETETPCQHIHWSVRKSWWAGRGVCD